jgi:NADH dehydrogenase [ubiquinone] 1 alpha subcomplex assembly factor 1
MMREKIRTVGISAVLSSPTRPSSNQMSAQGVSPLSKRQVVDEGDDWGPDGEFLAPEELGKRGARRGGSYNFDLGIEG